MTIRADGNSRAARSARAKAQLRDRYGRWIEMGGGAIFHIRGVPKAVHGTVTGWDAPHGLVHVKLDSGQTVSIPANKMEQPKAIIRTPPKGAPRVPDARRIITPARPEPTQPAPAPARGPDGAGPERQLSPAYDPLLSQITSIGIDADTAQRIDTQLAKLHSQYGMQFRAIWDAKDEDPNAVAFVGTRNGNVVLGLNPRLVMDHEGHRQEGESGFAVGYDVEAVITHEYGHFLAAAAPDGWDAGDRARYDRDTENQVVTQFFGGIPYQYKQARKGVSDYAASLDGEATAEIFSKYKLGDDDTPPWINFMGKRLDALFDGTATRPPPAHIQERDRIKAEPQPQPDDSRLRDGTPGSDQLDKLFDNAEANQFIDEWEFIKQLDAAFGFKDHKGYSQKVTEVFAENDAFGQGVKIEYKTQVTKDGEVVGTSKRTLSRTPAGTIRVENDNFLINAGHQGQGVASHSLKIQKDFLASQGVEAITVHANISVGGYAQARAGFGWAARMAFDEDYRTVPDEMLDDARQAVLHGHVLPEYTPQVLGEIERLRSKYMANRGDPTAWPTPFEISKLGEGVTPPDMVSVAKVAMLRSDWLGVMPLGDHVATDHQEVHDTWSQHYSPVIEYNEVDAVASGPDYPNHHVDVSAPAEVQQILSEEVNKLYPEPEYAPYVPITPNPPPPPPPPPEPEVEVPGSIHVPHPLSGEDMVVPPGWKLLKSTTSEMYFLLDTDGVPVKGWNSADGGKIPINDYHKSEILRPNGYKDVTPAPADVYRKRAPAAAADEPEDPNNPGLVEDEDYIRPSPLREADPGLFQPETVEKWLQYTADPNRQDPQAEAVAEAIHRSRSLAQRLDFTDDFQRKLFIGTEAWKMMNPIRAKEEPWSTQGDWDDLVNEITKIQQITTVEGYEVYIGKFWNDVARYLNNPELTESEVTPASAVMRTAAAAEKLFKNDTPALYRGLFETDVQFAVGDVLPMRPSSFTDTDISEEDGEWAETFDTVFRLAPNSTGALSIGTDVMGDLDEFLLQGKFQITAITPNDHDQTVIDIVPVSRETAVPPDAFRKRAPASPEEINQLDSEPPEVQDAPQESGIPFAPSHTRLLNKWGNPLKLYHGAPPEHADAIEKEGLQSGDGGVHMSESPETAGFVDGFWDLEEESGGEGEWWSALYEIDTSKIEGLSEGYDGFGTWMTNNEDIPLEAIKRVPHPYVHNGKYLPPDRESFNKRGRVDDLVERLAKIIKNNTIWPMSASKLKSGDAEKDNALIDAALNETLGEFFNVDIYQPDYTAAIASTRKLYDLTQSLSDDEILSVGWADIETIADEIEEANNKYPTSKMSPRPDDSKVSTEPEPEVTPEPEAPENVDVDRNALYDELEDLLKKQTQARRSGTHGIAARLGGEIEALNKKLEDLEAADAAPTPDAFRKRAPASTPEEEPWTERPTADPNLTREENAKIHAAWVDAAYKRTFREYAKSLAPYQRGLLDELGPDLGVAALDMLNGNNDALQPFMFANRSRAVDLLSQKLRELDAQGELELSDGAREIYNFGGGPETILKHRAETAPLLDLDPGPFPLSPNGHEQAAARTLDGLNLLVDKGIARVLEASWKFGLKTRFSDQGDLNNDRAASWPGEFAPAWITFTSMSEAWKFVKATGLQATNQPPGQAGKDVNYLITPDGGAVVTPNGGVRWHPSYTHQLLEELSAAKPPSSARRPWSPDRPIVTGPGAEDVPADWTGLRDWVASKDKITLDTETTGLSVEDGADQVVELAATRVRADGTVDKFSMLVNPGMPIHPAASAVHGITDDMVKDASTPAQVFELFKAWANQSDNNLLVAHNANFDNSAVAGMSPDAPAYLANSTFLDTFRLARAAVPKRDEGGPTSSHALGALVEAFDVKLGNAHRAGDDAQATSDLLPKILDFAAASDRPPDAISDLSGKNQQFNEAWPQYLEALENFKNPPPVSKIDPDKPNLILNEDSLYVWTIPDENLPDAIDLSEQSFADRAAAYGLTAVSKDGVTTVNGLGKGLFQFLRSPDVRWSDDPDRKMTVDEIAEQVKNPDGSPADLGTSGIGDEQARVMGPYGKTIVVDADQVPMLQATWALKLNTLFSDIGEDNRSDYPFGFRPGYMVFPSEGEMEAWAKAADLNVIVTSRGDRIEGMDQVFADEVVANVNPRNGQAAIYWHPISNGMITRNLDKAESAPVLSDRERFLAELDKLLDKQDRMEKWGQPPNPPENAKWAAEYLVHINAEIDAVNKRINELDKSPAPPAPDAFRKRAPQEGELELEVGDVIIFRWRGRRLTAPVIGLGDRGKVQVRLSDGTETTILPLFIESIAPAASEAPNPAPPEREGVVTPEIEIENDDPEVAALEKYSEGAYQFVNSGLRSGDVSLDGTDEYSQVASKLHDLLDRQSLPEQTIVYRALAFDGDDKKAWREFVGALTEEGQVVTDLGFMSTSVDDEKAAEFLDPNYHNNADAKVGKKASNRVMLNLTLPAGSKAMDISQISSSAIAGEVLVQDGHSFRIDNVFEEEGDGEQLPYMEVHATLLPPNEAPDASTAVEVPEQVEPAPPDAFRKRAPKTEETPLPTPKRINRATRTDDKRTGQGQTPTNFVNETTGAPMSKTETGDTFEQLFMIQGKALIEDKFGAFELVTGAGSGTSRTTPLDLVTASHGAELKTLSKLSPNQKTAIKADEITRKMDAIGTAKLKPLLLVQVVDQENHTISLHGMEMFGSKAVSRMEHFGTYAYSAADFLLAQQQAGHADKAQARADKARVPYGLPKEPSVWWKAHAGPVPGNGLTRGSVTADLLERDPTLHLVGYDRNTGNGLAMTMGGRRVIFRRVDGFIMPLDTMDPNVIPSWMSTFEEIQ